MFIVLMPSEKSWVSTAIGDHDADRVRGLECEPDGDCRRASCGSTDTAAPTLPARRRVAVKQRDPVQHEVEQKAERACTTG